MEKEAREKARKYLEEDGFKNICMSAGRLCQPDDKAFQFSFSSDKMIDELDCYDNKFLEPVANLITIMQLEEYKREVLKEEMKMASYLLMMFYLVRLLYWIKIIIQFQGSIKLF